MKPLSVPHFKSLDPHARGVVAEELHAELSRRVVGQREAVDAVVDTLQVVRAGLAAPGRPLGSLLFLGPTGTGKTRMVESVAEALIGDPQAIVKVDCAEYQHGHEIAKLIGSPPGYLGHRETRAALSQEALNQWHRDGVNVSIVLFDEIEKASDALWNLLLGILDKAKLTLGDNRVVDFSRTVIFMTSNLGARELSSARSPLGFNSSETLSSDKVSRVALEAMRRKFTPEFINRIDRTVVFQSLTTNELGPILDLELKAIELRLARSYAANILSTHFLLRYLPEAKELLIEKGFNPTYGARFLKRVIEREVMTPVVNLIASGQIQDGDVVEIGRTGEEITFARGASA